MLDDLSALHAPSDSEFQPEWPAGPAAGRHIVARHVEQAPDYVAARNNLFRAELPKHITGRDARRNLDNPEPTNVSASEDERALSSGAGFPNDVVGDALKKRLQIGLLESLSHLPHQGGLCGHSPL